MLVSEPRFRFLTGDDIMHDKSYISPRNTTWKLRKCRFCPEWTCSQAFMAVSGSRRILVLHDECYQTEIASASGGQKISGLCLTELGDYPTAKW